MTDNLECEWQENERWQGIQRPYCASDVLRLRGTFEIDYAWSKKGSKKLWWMLTDRNRPAIRSLGAVTGGQAVQQIKAGLSVIYVSGWQVAADQNSAHETYPDLSLYPCDSVPTLCQRINHALERADQIQHAQHHSLSAKVDFFAPLVADGEAGFGGVLHVYELTKSLIRNGAAAIHLEDQCASLKKCGHLGGKVIIPTHEMIDKLVAARLASDVMNVPLLIIARTDAESASFMTYDSDVRDHPFVVLEAEKVDGFVRVRHGLDMAIARALSYAPFADMLWWETSTPNLEHARRFAEAIHNVYPDKLLAYNCSPSFHWSQYMTTEEMKSFQHELEMMGYRFIFVTLAGIHSMWYNMFDLAHAYHRDGMYAYVSKVQQPEFRAHEKGYHFVAHQQEVGTEYFDQISRIVMGKAHPSNMAMESSTERQQSFGH